MRRVWQREPATVTAPRQRRRIVFPLLLGILALLGAVVGLLGLLSPVPRPFFVPLDVVNYRSLLMPIPNQGYADRQSMRRENHFPRTLADAYASQDRIFLVKDLGALEGLSAKDTVVVYLACWACAAGRGEIFLFPGDTNPDVPSSRLQLGEALQTLRACPARAKLLILDIMQPLAAANGPAIPPGRLGVLLDNVSSRVEPELAAVPDPNRLVLCACSPGQNAWATQALGRSVFHHYLDEGLRGWAETTAASDRRDGRVDVLDLARYVASRVDRWTWQNLGVRQTPLLHGTGPNFSLMALSRGQPQPRSTTPPLPVYPAWLLADWQLLDQWRAKNYYSRSPRAYRQMEAHILRSERRWRGGEDIEQVRQQHQTYLNLIVRQMNLALEVVPTPQPHSLALERTLGHAPDAAVTQTVQTLLTQLAEQTRGLPPAKAQPIRDKLALDFSNKHKDTPPYDLASAVFEAARNDTRLDPDTLRFLDDLLRPSMPQPRYVETAFLHRLRQLAEQTGNAAFPAASARLALRVLGDGERAASRFRPFPWVRGLLDRAARARHDGEVLLLASGYASPADADRRLREAADRQAAVLVYQDIIERALESRDEAFSLLPNYFGFLEEMPSLEAPWRAAAMAAIALEESLGRQPAANAPLSAEALHAVTAVLQEQTAALQDWLEPLRRPFREDTIQRLLTQSQRETAGVETARELERRLAIPYLPAKTRFAVWQAALNLRRRLQERTAQQDEDNLPPSDTALPAADREGWERGERERAALRARSARILFRLAGLRPELQDSLEKAQNKAFTQHASPETIYSLSRLLQQTWTEQFAEQLRGEQNPFAADRLARIYPPADFWPRAAEPALQPRPRLLIAQARELWAWRAMRAGYAGRDLGGGPLDFQMARDDALAAGEPVPPEPTVEIAGCSESPRLDPTHRVAQCTLRLRFSGPFAAAKAASLRLRAADNDWLHVTPGVAAPGVGPAGPWPLELDPANPIAEREVVLRIALKPDAEQSTTPPPRGFLVEVTIAGYTFHHLVPVALSLNPAHPEIVLSADPRNATDPLGDLRLRPAGVPQPYYLYVRNPTDKAQNVVVELTAKGVSPAGGLNKLTVPPRSIQRVVFVALPPPTAAPAVEGPALLPELIGPLRIRLLDAADPNQVHDTREVQVQAASPREYVQVESIRFQPPSMANGDANRLAVRLRARRPLSPPPCQVELSLPADRIPGFLGAQTGTYRGLLPADGKKELRLFAANLRFAESGSDQGYAYLNVDTFARAFLFRTTFSRQGEPTTPREDYQPALRLQAEPFSPADANFRVHVEVDNAPAYTTLEVGLGRLVNGRFQADLLRTFAEPRQRRIGFSPSGPGGALLFDAVVRDWTVTLDARLIIGPRLLRARLLDRAGEEVKVAMQPVSLVNRPPGDVQFLGVPPLAQRGTPLPVQAMGFDGQSDMKQVNFFIGKPLADKLPPNAVLTPGTPVAGSKGVWSAQLPIPATASGPTDLGVQFINGAGLSTFGTATVNVVEKLPAAVGTVRGTVEEGGIRQPVLEVVLRDEKAAVAATNPKAADKGFELKTKTGMDGAFLFNNVPPGKYTVTATKPSSGRAGQQPVTVEAGQTATVAITLFLN